MPSNITSPTDTGREIGIGLKNCQLWAKKPEIHWNVHCFMEIQCGERFNSGCRGLGQLINMEMEMETETETETAMELETETETAMECNSKSMDDGGYKESNIKKARLQSTLAALVNDPILADVPNKPTLSDVDTLISLELGSAMRISVLKLDATSFDVALMNSATLKDLKLGIKKKINAMEQSKMGHRHISWKHVWGNFCLSYHNQKLLDDNAALHDFGIRNNSQVHFVPYVAPKDSHRHSKRRRHRFFHGLTKRS